MKKYEYKVLNIELKKSSLSRNELPSSLRAELNEFGRDGWEVVATAPLAWTNTVGGVGIILKRELPN